MDRIREMLAAAEADAPLRLGTVDVAALVDRAVAVVEDAHPEVERRITVTTPQEVLATVDGARLSQAVRELLVMRLRERARMRLRSRAREPRL